jgi:hypothetical protein
MRRRVIAAMLLPSFAGIALMAARTTSARTANPLRSFYVTWLNHLILDVSPLGDDVRVRLIRMEWVPSCSSSVVTAVERVMPRATVASIAETDICANTEKSVDAAFASARKTGVEKATAGVVEAQCGDEKRVFSLPLDEDLDQRALKRSSPRVSELETMFDRVHRRVFGKSFSLVPQTAQQQQEMETLGAALVPELTSGKYNVGFEPWKCLDQSGKNCVPNYLAWRLRGYRLVPPSERRPKPELLDAASFHLTAYVAPVYPSIAESARISGDVQLRLIVDRETGGVTNVAIIKDVLVYAGVVTNVEIVNDAPVKGASLLSPAAVEAARKWRFAPEYLDGQPILATVRFSFDC